MKRAAGRAYFDTSVLVKRYIDEAGSRETHARLSSALVMSSAIVPVEFASAFRRRVNAGDLGIGDFDDALSWFRRDLHSWELVEVNEHVLTRAEEIASLNGLRALDAIHVASALVCQEQTGVRIPFVTADVRQNEAAIAAGLETVFIGKG